MISFLIVFLLIFNVNFLECSASLEPIQNTKSNLTKFICDAADEISKHETETIAIVKLRNNFSSQFLDEFHNCMPANVTMVQLDLESSLVKVKVKEAKFVVVFGDDVDESQFIQLVDERNPEQILSHMTKFLFISTKQKSWGLSEVLPNNGILNFASVFEDENGEISVEVSNHFANTSETLRNVPKHEIISKLYPDKLKNMHKAALRIINHPSLINVKVKNGKAISVHSHLLKAFNQLHNATYTNEIIETPNILDALKQIGDKFLKLEIDLTLGGTVPVINKSRLISFIENGYCALVPEPIHKSPLIVHKLAGVPFHAALTLLTIMILWRVYRAKGEAHGSSWKLAFGIAMSLLGQPFKIRTSNSLMFLVIMKSVFLAFILNNLYQARLTSDLTKKLKMPQIETIPELFNSDYNFTVGIHIFEALQTIPEYVKAHSSGRVNVKTIKNIEDIGTVVVTRCDRIEDFMKATRSKSHYIFKHKLISFFTDHEMGYMNPYTEELQQLIIKTYSFGLHMAWKTFVELELSESVNQFEEQEDESSLLRFEHLKRVLIVMPLIMLCGFFILMFEIFYYECLAGLSWQYMMKKWAWREKKNVVRVRRIQVRPINETEPGVLLVE